MPELVVEDLAKSFGPATALDHVGFTVRDGEFFTLLGPSGCGKSTTLASIAGLERPDSGTIRVGDRVFVDQAAGTFLQPEERNLGMVFQSYALWPHMTLADNLALPLRIRRLPRDRQRPLIDGALDQVGLLSMRDRYPHQLSGGQQQRVALARALVYSPTVLLLDEPLSNLDAQLREQARAWLKRLQRDVGVTTIYVTHDQVEALSLSDRIAVMQDGRVLQCGTPTEIYQHPSSPDVAGFVGHCNFLPGTVRGADGRSGGTVVDLESVGRPLLVRAGSPVAAGARVLVGVRSERLGLCEPVTGAADSPNVLSARLVQRSYVGARFEYQLRVGEAVVRAESAVPFETGELSLTVPPEACLLYPYESGGQRETEREPAVDG